jgi:excisionase family DNA binding protein
MTLFTPSEAASRLKLKPVTVIRMFDSGELPGVVLRQGRRQRILRFREETLETFIADKEQRRGQRK